MPYELLFVGLQIKTRTLHLKADRSVSSCPSGRVPRNESAEDAVGVAVGMLLASKI